MNYQIGIYITDASFDHSTKVASVSFIEITKKYSSEKHIKVNNIFEAEYIGIKECMIHASRRFNNILIICDSKQAIREAKKEIYNNKKWNRKIKDIQLIWLPRDFTVFADFLTKNIQNKKENKDLKIEVFKENIERFNIMDVYVTEQDKEKMLKEWVEELNEKFNLNIQFKNKKLERVLKKGIYESIYYENENEIGEDIKNIIKLNPTLIDKEGLLNKIITIVSFSS